MSFSSDPLVLITIMLLIISGGLGFIVVGDLFEKKQWRHFSFHSRIVLISTVFFILVPTGIFFFGEFSHAFLHLKPSEKLLNAFFHSVTTRTAGFNSIDMLQFHDGSLFLKSILMFIGAGPGGCAGGVKITVFLMLILSLRSLLLGREQIELMGRRIPADQVMRAIGILTLSFGLVTLLLIVLLAIEPLPFREVFFETVSAFGTVGLSLGITAQLSSVGKFLICVAMFTGRIGPLTAMYLVGQKKGKSSIKYPEGKVLLG
jgi:trk system potassium uptake protein TrkH